MTFTPKLFFDKVIGTATPELIFTVTTDAAKWVQIYGLLRPTDANDDITYNMIDIHNI